MGKKNDLMVGVDLGGTSMTSVALDGRGRVLASRKRSTCPGLGPEGVTRRVAATVRKLLKDLGEKSKRVQGIGIGAPGTVDPEKGLVLYAPNLEWKDQPLGSMLRRHLRLPVTLDNDVNGGAVGEHVLGSGRGARNLVAIFVGTGIGGGVILDNRLYHGSCGGAGEVGHIKVLADGPLCGCGRNGCAEGLASRTAMERDMRLAVDSGRSSLVPAIMARMGRERMTSRVIQEALQEGDPLMLEIMQRAQTTLGLLVASLVNLLDPDCVVIGGGIADRLGDRFLEPIRATAAHHILRAPHLEPVKILPSRLADHAGAVGAAVLAWNRLAGINPANS